MKLSIVVVIVIVVELTDINIDDSKALTELKWNKHTYPMKILVTNEIAADLIIFFFLHVFFAKEWLTPGSDNN